jgi:hypothetical protein
MNPGKIFITIFIIFIIFFIISCDKDSANKEEGILSHIINGIDFGDKTDMVKDKLRKQDVTIRESTMDSGEILIFLQNVSKDSALKKEIIDYISSDKFSPENPLDEILTKIEIYNLDFPDIGNGLANSTWEPAELYFYEGILFGFSSFVPSKEHKDKLLELFKEFKDIDEDDELISLDQSYEAQGIYLNINIADNLYLYEKSIYSQAKIYVVGKLRAQNTDE